MKKFSRLYVHSIFAHKLERLCNLFQLYNAHFCISCVITQMRLEFDEDTEAFFGPNGIVGPSGNNTVRKAPARQNADVSVETLKTLVARVKGIIRWYLVAKNG